jgi:hypothetical protein
MDKQLRLYAAEIVVESDLSKAAKVQLINFIQNEATDAQVKALILDGRIIKLDEQAEEIVNDRFDLLEVDPASVEAGMMMGGVGAIGAMLGAVVARAAYKVYRNYLSKAGRACAGRSGEDRQRCIGDFKVRAKIAALKAASTKCSQAKDPEKCKAKLQKKIAKLENTLSNR